MNLTHELAPYFIHRSGTETLWTCPRKYFYEYLYDDTGIRHTPTKLQLVVGTAVHFGLAHLCSMAQLSIKDALTFECCSDAIESSINYFRSTDSFQHLKLHEKAEQEMLIAGLLWAFFYHSWPVFVSTFEVITVERAWVETFDYQQSGVPLVHISSRPDVIVRHRATNEFIGISWKTIDSITEYKRYTFRENLQNLMETYYGEKLLSIVLEDEYSLPPDLFSKLRGRALIEATEKAIAEFRSLPREIAYVQTIFLVKGPRQAELLDGTLINWEDGQYYDEQERTWRQQSFLCYRYVNGGLAVPESPETSLEAVLAESLKPGSKGRKSKVPEAPKKSRVSRLSQESSWSYRYWKPGNKSYNNLSGDWLRQPLWEARDLTIQQWVEQLHEGGVFPSSGVEVSDADGVLDPRNSKYPLSRVVVWDDPVERAKVLMEDTVAEVEAAHYSVVTNNMHDGVFDMTRFERRLSVCNNSAPAAGVPVKCEYKDICLTSAPALIQIGGTSEWVRRRPHHEAERESFRERGLLTDAELG
jgi:PD-(D/E)XK nuclease superfamily